NSLSGKFRPARMVKRIGHCLGHELGEIVVSVMTPITRSGTERPREPLLQLYIGFSCLMCRIGGSRRSSGASRGGDIREIPPFGPLNSNSVIAEDNVWWVV